MSLAQTSTDRTLTIMSHNAENLFDTADNPTNPGDYEFLPTPSSTFFAPTPLYAQPYG